jgi:uncharacterized membrane protein YhhN
VKPVLPVVAALLLTGPLAIYAGTRDMRRLFTILKPLATLLILGVALLSLVDPGCNPTYTLGVTVALSLSLVGDIALLREDKQKWFMLGLASFLLAHTAYTVVFALLGQASAWDALTLVLLLALGIAFYSLIRAQLGRMRLPVIGYMVVISVMVSRAGATVGSPRSTPLQATLIITGASLFYISDMLVAANRFWRPWKYRRLGLAPYYIGQLLLALSASCCAS